MGKVEIDSFLSRLAINLKLSASTLNQVFYTLAFVDREPIAR
jgi:hypothetical protein